MALSVGKPWRAIQIGPVRKKGQKNCKFSRELRCPLDAVDCRGTDVEVACDGTDGLAVFEHGADLILLMRGQFELSPELDSALFGGRPSFLRALVDEIALMFGKSRKNSK